MAAELQDLKRAIEATVERLHERVKAMEDRMAATDKQIAHLASRKAENLSDREIFRQLLDKLIEAARGD